MYRTVRGTTKFDVKVQEKFSMIYLECHDLILRGDEKKVKRGYIPSIKDKWHLEDEQRPQLALCGQNLHGLAVSVSAGLAMFASPCRDCREIVENYLTEAEQHMTRRRRFMSLLRNDVDFRNRVKSVVSNALFQKNYLPEEGKLVEQESKKAVRRTRAKDNEYDHPKRKRG